MKWSFYQIWNESLEEGNSNKPLVPREKIWASELGGAFVDRFLKMKATPMTNPPNPRSLRKFEAGNIWEAIIGYVLLRAGILVSRQEWLQYQYDGLLPVSGKLDYIAGGKPNYELAIQTIDREFSWLPSFISRATQKIITRLNEKYPNGLENIILEVKSCSSYMFEIYEKKNQAEPKHALQDFHYLKTKHLGEGHVLYVCKDDARLLEIEVLNPSDMEIKYRWDIEQMTNYVKNNQRPSLEPCIVFDGVFSANFKVGYSNYLTMLYGFKNQKEFDDKYKPACERWNRVIERSRAGKRITNNNLEAIKEMKDNGFDFEKITSTWQNPTALQQLKEEKNVMV